MTYPTSTNSLTLLTSVYKYFSRPDPAEKAASAAQQSLSQETAATPSGEDEEASSTEEEEPPVSEGVQDIIQSAIELGSSLEDGQKTDQPDDDIIYEDDENGDDDEDYRAGALVRGDDEIQAKKGELPDCDELGYENVSDDKSVSFPCKGRDASAPSEDGQKR